MIPRQRTAMHPGQVLQRPMVMTNGQQRASLQFIPNGGGSMRTSIRPSTGQGHQHPGPSQRFPTPSASQSTSSASKSTQPQSSKSDSNKPWGWTTMDGVIVPYIMRGKEKFVSVKMVESKLLSKFPKINMEDMTNVGPIYSYYITDTEAKQLTEINTRCYNHGFGAKSFTTKDLIVSLENFTNFYNRAKTHFESKMAAEVPISGGWVQINNTVVPYLLRDGVKFVPLSVIKYAAGLLTDIRMDGYKVPVTEKEYNFLNTCCRSAHINFTFSIKTKLIKLELVIRMSQSKVNITHLPNQDPFSHAQYQYDRQNSAESAQDASAMQGYQMPIMQPTMQMSPQAHQQMSPPNLLPLQQHMPPRNPFLPLPPRQRLGIPMQHQQGHPPPPPPYNQRMPMPFMRHQVPPGSVTATMSRELRTPSPSISPRTQANMVMSMRGPRPKTNSSSPNSRPSSAQSRGSITPPSEQSTQSASSTVRSNDKPSNEPIEVFRFEGKDLSCLMRGASKEPFALLEALVQLFFPQFSLEDFQSTLEQVLNVPVLQLNAEEEMSFIRFYDLNVKSLRSKAIVSFNRIKDIYPRLCLILKSGDSEDSQDSITDTSLNSDVTKTNGASKLSENTTIMQPEETTETGKRKLGTSHQTSKKAKQFHKRLEDTVAMLRMRQGPKNAPEESELHPVEEAAPMIIPEAEECLTFPSISDETSEKIDDIVIGEGTNLRLSSGAVEEHTSIPGSLTSVEHCNVPMVIGTPIGATSNDTPPPKVENESTVEAIEVHEQTTPASNIDGNGVVGDTSFLQGEISMDDALNTELEEPTKSILSQGVENDITRATSFTINETAVGDTDFVTDVFQGKQMSNDCSTSGLLEPKSSDHEFINTHSDSMTKEAEQNVAENAPKLDVDTVSKDCSKEDDAHRHVTKEDKTTKSLDEPTLSLESKTAEQINKNKVKLIVLDHDAMEEAVQDDCKVQANDIIESRDDEKRKNAVQSSVNVEQENGDTVIHSKVETHTESLEMTCNTHIVAEPQVTDEMKVSTETETTSSFGLCNGDLHSTLLSQRNAENESKEDKDEYTTGTSNTRLSFHEYEPLALIENEKTDNTNIGEALSSEEISLQAQVPAPQAEIIPVTSTFIEFDNLPSLNQQEECSDHTLKDKSSLITDVKPNITASPISEVIQDKIVEQTNKKSENEMIDETAEIYEYSEKAEPPSSDQKHMPEDNSIDKDKDNIAEPDVFSSQHEITEDDDVKPEENTSKVLSHLSVEQSLCGPTHTEEISQNEDCPIIAENKSVEESDFVDGKASEDNSILDHIDINERDENQNKEVSDDLVPKSEASDMNENDSTV